MSLATATAAKAAAAILSGQYDDGLTTFYEVLPDASLTHIQHNGGIGRTAVQFLVGASGLGVPVKSVRLRFRKYGLPTGPIIVNIRKGSDDTVAATIGTFDIQHFPQGVETELSIRNRFNNTYNMVANDSVSVEFPSISTSVNLCRLFSACNNLLCCYYYQAWKAIFNTSND